MQSQKTENKSGAHWYIQLIKIFADYYFSIFKMTTGLWKNTDCYLSFFRNVKVDKIL